MRISPRAGRRLPPTAAVIVTALIASGLAAGSASADAPRFTDQATASDPGSTGSPSEPAAASSADEHYPQASGERILGLPDQPTCTVVMTKNYPMANTAYGPDEPYRGRFHPGECEGPWTRIVAHVHSNVTGVQFDRIAWINLGGRRIVTFSSQEPRGEGAGQVVQDETYDVTRYANLFTDGRKVEFNIANVVTGPYTGIFYADLSFEFYDDSATPLPEPPLDVVTGLDAATILEDPVSQTFSIPIDTTDLWDEIYVKASGGCDEFWWAAAPAGYPGQCDSYPIREIEVSIDDRPAALVNTYPAVFTGADGPSWWHPIPAPRAYDLRPYTVDLGPFIGSLTDGADHTITYTIPKRRWTDGNDVTIWSNLLIMRNPASDDRTTGTVGLVKDHPVKIDDEGDAQHYSMDWHHALSVRGTTKLPGEHLVQRRTSFVVEAQTYGGATNDDRYSWDMSTRSTDLYGSRVTSRTADYRLQYLTDGWALLDRARSEQREDGALQTRTRLHDKMRSKIKSGTPTGRHSSEDWSLATDGPLGCGTTHLVGENPNLLKNKETDRCEW